MPGSRRITIIGGVDTHGATHHAAAVDRNGKLIADQQFPATRQGYAQLLTWLRSIGTVREVGIEGTGAYGAGLARYLHQQGVSVLEVPRPDRRLRRQQGKSDPIDAQAAARSVLAGLGIQPKLNDGPIEALRMLRVARSGAIKAKTAATNTLRAILVTAPAALREQLRGLRKQKLITTCQLLRADITCLHDPTNAAKAALRSLATRINQLEAEASGLEKQIQALTRSAAPATSAVFGLGPDTVSALLIAVGDNPDRLRTEAAFAHLCGVSPVPASSGKTNRHRLHRGGNRTANSALHVAVIVRLRHDADARNYANRRTTEGKTMPEIIRCQKRYLAREVFKTLSQDYTKILT